MTRIVIGRSDTADVQVEDDTVSSLHLELTLRGPDIYLRDLDSTNGTKLKGADGRWTPVRDCQVNAHHTIMMGEYDVTIREILDVCQIDHSAASSSAQPAQRSQGPRPISVYIRNADGSYRKGS